MVAYKFLTEKFLIVSNQNKRFLICLFFIKSGKEFNWSSVSATFAFIWVCILNFFSYELELQFWYWINAFLKKKSLELYKNWFNSIARLPSFVPPRFIFRLLLKLFKAEMPLTFFVLNIWMWYLKWHCYCRWSSWIVIWKLHY